VKPRQCRPYLGHSQEHEGRWRAGRHGHRGRLWAW